MKKAYYFIPLISSILAATSYFFTLGWFRIILIFVPIPLVFTVLYIWFSFSAISILQKSKKVKKLFIASSITYILSFIFLPDFADSGEMGVMGQPINSVVFDFCITLAIILFIISVVLISMMKYQTSVIKISMGDINNELKTEN